MKTWNAVLLIAWIAAIPGTSPAGPASKPSLPDLTGASLTVRLELEGPGGLEQVAVVFKGAEVLLSGNSNFISPAGISEPARVGVFSLPVDDSIRNLRRSMIQASKRLGGPTGAVDPPARVKARGAHVARLYVNGREVPESSLLREGLIQRVVALYEQDNWKPLAGIEARLNPAGDRIESRGIGADASKGTGRHSCARSSNGRRKCRVPGAGTIHFSAP